MPTATPFNNLITFSRGSNATVTGSNGLIQWAPSNVLLNSEQFNDAYWIKLNASVTANTSTAPDGSATADTLASTSSVSNTTGAYRGISYAVGHSLSVYVKAGTSSIAWVSSNTGESYGVFNLTTGAVIGSANGTATIAPVGNGWFRIAVENVTVAGTFFIVGGKDSYSTGHPWASGTWTSGNTIHIWGAQLELGSTATTYNPTTVKNLLGFSEAFDNAGWSKLNTSIVTGAQANPVNGLFNAQKLMEDTANAQHIVQQGFSVLSGTPYVFSVYAKAAGRNRFSFRFGSIAPADSVTFDLSNGTIVTGTAGYVASIVSIGSGWYRCSITSTPSSSGTRQHQIYLNSTSGSGAETYTGDGNSGVYIYGAQLSDSASLDPYVPTPGAAPSSTAFYGPRFDFDPVTLQPRGLLVEEQRTNLFTYSDDFANAAWTKSSATVTANQAVSPDGTTNADLLQITAQFGRLQAGSVTLGTVYTFSIWARTASGTRVYSLYDAAGNPIGTLTATTAWTRHTITFTAPATSTLYVMQDRNAGPFVNTFIYGAQLEAGAFATSYIPTVASTVTRSADVATITGQNFAQWFGQTEGTFVADVLDNAAGVNVLVASDGTTTNQLIMTSSTLNIFSVFTGGAFQAMLGVTPPAPYKTTGAYKVNDFAAAANGGTVSTDTSGTLATYSRLSIGANAVSNAAFLNGHIRNIRFIPARAADFQLQALST